MPLIERSAEELDREEKEKWEDRDYQQFIDDKKRTHELELVKVKASIPQRHKTITRICLAVAKLPVMMVLAITIPILILSKRDVPAALFDFLML